MKIAVIDTEGTGLFNYALPADHPSQPRIAAFGAVLLSTRDEFAPAGDPMRALPTYLGQCLDPFVVDAEIIRLVKPDGWTMPPEAGAVNGLTDEVLARDGVPIAEVLELFTGFVRNGWTILAYNASHDLKHVRGELRRASLPDLFEATPNVCLMRAATPVCKIPGKRGFKFPKLAEACAFFGVPPEPNPHNALDGARRAAAVFLALHHLKALPKPDVYRKKESPVVTTGAAPLAGRA